jgi:superfamily II DNA or RNA helicase
MSTAGLLFAPVPPRPATPALHLRPYQVRAVEAIKGSIRSLRAAERAPRVLCVAPTGAGKTVLFARVVAGAAAKGTPCTILAHRAELLEQTWAKLIDAGIPEELLGMTWADDRRANPRALVQVASVQTLARRARRGHAGIVVVDEAHRALGASYQTIAADFPDAVHLGFTATPWRLDGQGMGAFYNALTVVATVPELIEQGYLCAPRVFSHPVKPDLSKIKIRGGDYDERDLAKAVDTAVLVGNLVEHWLRLAQGARTIAFAASVEHSKNIVAAFVAAGVPAEHLDGSMSSDARAAILARLASGETRVVSNCQVLTEGFDCPAVKCVILARPTKSRALYMQCVGRAMRPSHEEPELRFALVLDHAGCAHEHGLPQDPQEYSLEPGKRRRKGDGEMPVRTCEACYAVAPTSASECPVCGAPFPPRERKDIPEREGELREMKADEERARALDEAASKRLRGRIQGWAVNADQARGWMPGETNRLLAARFGSRVVMERPQLERVWQFVSGGEFDRRYPVPAPIVSPAAPFAPAAPAAPPAWLLPEGDELTEVAL